MERLRRALTTTGYTSAAVAALVGAEAFQAYLDGWTGPAERALERGGELGTLGRLFALGRVVAVAEVEDLPTVTPEDLVDAGLIKVTRGRAHPLVAIDGIAADGDPIYLVADRIPLGESAPDPGFVGGITPSLETIIRLVPRRARGRVLDAGCRSGALALLLSADRDAVVATEGAERAAGFARFNIAFNQATNIELRDGDLYDPVAGEEFDLVVSDRPRLIPLDRAGEGLAAPADHVTGDAVAGAGARLRPGGWAVMTAQWTLEDGESVDDHVANWLAGAGCDALVIHQRSESPESHVAARLRQLGRLAPAAASDLFNRWSEDLVAQKVTEVGTGVVVLRRRPEGQPWLTVRTLPALPPGDLTGALATLFHNQEWLSTRSESGRMLDEILRLPSGVLLRPAPRVDNGRWVTDGVTAEAAGGLFTGGRLSDTAAAVLSRCEGRNTLGQHFDEVYLGEGVKPPDWAQSVAAVRRDLDDVARRMVGMGLLVVPPGS